MERYIEEECIDRERSTNESMQTSHEHLSHSVPLICIL